MGSVYINSNCSRGSGWSDNHFPDDAISGSNVPRTSDESRSNERQPIKTKTPIKEIIDLVHYIDTDQSGDVYLRFDDAHPLFRFHGVDMEYWCTGPCNKCMDFVVDD